MKIVSFVIPCYNDAANLPKAVESCLTQGVKCEVVIVDDRSTDKSLAVAQRLAKQDPERIRVLSTETNSGPAIARNLGAREARGDLLCFLDSDDLYLPGFARNCVRVLAKHPDVAAIKTGFTIANPDGTSPLAADDPRHGAAANSYPCNMMLRRDAFMLTGGFPEDKRFRGPIGGEDIALYQAITALFKVARAPAPLVRHHNRPDSHLERFLKRSAVKNGRIVITSSDPSFGEKDVNAAVRDHVRAAAQRVLGAKAMLSHLKPPRAAAKTNEKPKA